MSFLLDTNVISEARKRDGDAAVREWLASTPGRDLFLSVLVIGEFRQGIERLRRRDPQRAQVFDDWLRHLREEYRDRLLPVTVDVAEEWGRLNVPGPLPAIDSLLAATAKVYGLTLATRNTADVARTGVPTINPFAS